MSTEGVQENGEGGLVGQSKENAQRQQNKTAEPSVTERSTDSDDEDVPGLKGTPNRSNGGYYSEQTPTQDTVRVREKVCPAKRKLYTSPKGEHYIESASEEERRFEGATAKRKDHFGTQVKSVTEESGTKTSRDTRASAPKNRSKSTKSSEKSDEADDPENAQSRKDGIDDTSHTKHTLTNPTLNKTTTVGEKTGVAEGEKTTVSVGENMTVTAGAGEKTGVAEGEKTTVSTEEKITVAAGAGEKAGGADEEKMTVSAGEKMSVAAREKMTIAGGAGENMGVAEGEETKDAAGGRTGDAVGEKTVDAAGENRGVAEGERTSNAAGEKTKSLNTKTSIGCVQNYNDEHVLLAANMLATSNMNTEYTSLARLIQEQSVTGHQETGWKGHYETCLPDHHGAERPDPHGAGRPDHYGPERYGTGRPDPHGAGRPDHYGPERYGTGRPDHHGAGRPDHYGPERYGTGRPDPHGAARPDHYGQTSTERHGRTTMMERDGQTPTEPDGRTTMGRSAMERDLHGAGRPDHYGPEHYGTGRPDPHGAGRPDHYHYGPERYGTGRPDPHRAGRPDHYGPERYGTERPDHHGARQPDHYGPEHYGTEQPDHHGARQPDHYGLEYYGTEQPDHHGAGQPDHYGLEYYGITDDTSPFPFNPEGAYCATSVQKGQKFENYLEEGIRRARIPSDCEVHFQWKLIPDHSSDKRTYCKPDVVFIRGSKGAIVDAKNYDGTYLPPNQVIKIVKDKAALKNTYPMCQTILGYIYARKNTELRKTVKELARKNKIKIYLEGKTDAIQLATIVYSDLVTVGTDLLNDRQQSRWNEVRR